MFPITDFKSVPGFSEIFSYNAYKASNNSILIAPGHYYMASCRRYVSWDLPITFVLGPGGSNPSSDAIVDGNCHYVYLDNAAIAASGSSEITADKFINRGGSGLDEELARPAYVGGRAGLWSPQNDRFLFPVLIGEIGAPANSVRNFTVGAGLYQLISTGTSQEVPTAHHNDWTQVVLKVPVFVRKAYVTVLLEYVDAEGLYNWRPDGSTAIGDNGFLGKVNTNSRLSSGLWLVDVKNSAFEVNGGGANNNTIFIRTSGWIMPFGTM